RVGFFAKASSSHSTTLNFPFLLLSPGSVEKLRYSQVPGRGGANRTFQVRPPSQNPATVNCFPLASPPVPVKRTSRRTSFVSAEMAAYGLGSARLAWRDSSTISQSRNGSETLA